jgi:hypothetical protein
MAAHYSTADLRKNLGDALGTAHFTGETIEVFHHGKLYAGIVSGEDLETFRALKAALGPEGLHKLVDSVLGEGKGLDEVVDEIRGDDDPDRLTSDDELARSPKREFEPS